MDYSKFGNILLRTKDSGVLRRMDEPYYTTELIGDGVWKIGSDGCLAYLVEGEAEAILIDTGYGCGNVRAFCQQLTTRPVSRVINTHDHFDHTALNGYFETAMMSEKTLPLATIPFQSFQGTAFPKCKKTEIVKNGDKIDLQGRTLEVFEIPDHAVGSIALLDKKARILFIGDEIGPFGKDIGGCVETVEAQFAGLLARRDDYDWLCHGHAGKLPAALVDQVEQNLRFILAGNAGVPDSRPPFRMPEPEHDAQGRLILMRDMPHPGDGQPRDPEAKAHIRVSKYAGCEVKYDNRFVHRA